MNEDISMTTNEIRSKSVDHTRTRSSLTRSSAIYIDEIRRIEEEEQYGLNILNNRFANYLNKIKILADKNITLHHQIDETHRKYMEDNEEEQRNLSEIQFNNLRQELNKEFKSLLLYQTRFQRADYDKKYYKNKLKYFSTTNQSQQQLDNYIYELNLLKEQYKKQEENLQVIFQDILFDF